MTFKDKFLDIITYHTDDGTSGYELSNEQIEETIAAVEQLVKEIIGEDEFGYRGKPDKQNAEQEIRSQLRDEQRKRLVEALDPKKPVDLTGVIEGDSELSND